MYLKIFINRPILAAVVSLVIMLCGLAAAFNAPVEQYPPISPPTIVISAQYPGASAETIERTIAAQLENKLNGISQVIYMASSSNGSGSATIRLTFEVGTNLNYSVNEVLNRVQSAMPLLPNIVQRLGVIVKLSSPDQLMTLDFYNDGDGKFDQYFLSNYLQRTVFNDLGRDLGVGQVNMFGMPYAMRVWLNLDKMNNLNVSANDIALAIQDQNNEYAIGRSGGTPNSDASLTYNVMGSHMMMTPSQFGNIIVRAQNNQIVRIKDVARVELAGSNYNTIIQSIFRDKTKPSGLDQKEVTILQVFMMSNGNQLQTKKSVQKILDKDVKSFPVGLKYHTAFDATAFVEASIKNVVTSLMEAFILVGLVILLFLQNWRASLLALITIPVSIIGSFACLYLLGYSVNTLTLFALILAIGIVVDDAIVVIENVERLKKQYPDLNIKQIVELSVHEVYSAVIAIGLVLSVVFLPVMMLGGLSGILYRQFAITIACTVVISAVTALTLTPAISCLLLKRHLTVGRVGLLINKTMDSVTNFYLKMATKIIDWGKYSILTVIMVIASVIWIFNFIPLGFIPNEDQGYFLASVTTQASSSLEQTKAATEKIANDIMLNKAVDEVTQVVGYDFLQAGGVSTNASTLVVRLKNWKDRKLKSDEVDSVIKYTNSLNTQYKNVKINAFNQPPIRGLSTTSNVEFYLEGKVQNDLKAFAAMADDVDKKLMQHKEVKKAYHLLDIDIDQILIEPDVDRAKFYKVDINNIYSTLQAVYSNRNINFAYIMQGLVWVVLQADYRFRVGVNNIANIYVKNRDGVLIPVNSLVKVKYFKSPQIVERFNGYLATKEIVEPNPGYTSGDIIKVIAYEMQHIPKGYGFDWFGISYQQQQSQKTSTLAFIFSFLMIYLVLCALYEMWRLPWVVVLGMPFALCGSGIMLLLRQQPNDLYFQISLLALLGLSAKNIILLIEFALQHFNAGHSARDSALYALSLRFRPIIMTSITFIMGALPLIFATGAGANAMHSVGTGIVGGMLGSVILGTLFVPAYFVLIMQNYKVNT
jgi:multidrug efflux pump